ncbi:MAG: DUF1345 domain-containing protein [Actinobacteria bacterium]|nr:MAG: DUF1345 domain-containing protein [Actinomycetota bacterium]
MAAAVGAVASGIAAAFLPWQATILIGWSTAATIYSARVWLVSRSMDARTTELHATSDDDSRVVADITLLAACVASLVAVGLALVKAAQTGGAAQALFTGIAVLSVVMAWVLVHTVFTLRYGHLYYQHRSGIEFHDDSDPTYRDFAYVAFTIGMTYQVSDTELKSRAIRATALRQALLSYLFGAVIIAMTINVVAGLLK